MGLIYFDACLLIYLVQRDSALGQRVSKVMADASDARFAISPLVKMECLVGPFKQRDRKLEHIFENVFEGFLLLDMPEPVYVEAAHLRGRLGLKTPDALHLACARHHRCDALWTNDESLSDASEGMARMVLQ